MSNKYWSDTIIRIGHKDCTHGWEIYPDSEIDGNLCIAYLNDFSNLNDRVCISIDQDAVKQVQQAIENVRLALDLQKGKS